MYMCVKVEICVCYSEYDNNLTIRTVNKNKNLGNLINLVCIGVNFCIIHVSSRILLSFSLKSAKNISASRYGECGSLSNVNSTCPNISQHFFLFIFPNTLKIKQNNCLLNSFSSKMYYITSILNSLRSLKLILGQQVDSPSKMLQFASFCSLWTNIFGAFRLWPQNHY